MSGYVAPNWPPPDPLGDGDAPVIIYGYIPSYTLAITASTLFALSFLAHCYQIFRYRTWYFVTIPIALILEVLGYIFRSFSAHKNPYNVLYFVLQYFFIVTAPVFLSAGIYAILSILIVRVGREYSMLPPRWVLGIFIASDAVCTIVQISGAALIGSAESNKKDPSTGNNILLAGLCVQVLVFFVFVCLTTAFLNKAKRVILEGNNGMKSFLIAFVAATLLVYMRTCFRLSETALGVTSYLFTNEKYFAGLEFVPIIMSFLLFNAFHPGRFLKKTTEATEREKQETRV